MRRLYKILLLCFPFIIILIGGCIYKNAALTAFLSGRKADFPKKETHAAPNTLLSDSVLADVRKVIGNREYHVSFDDQTRTFQSPNRKQNLRARYAPGALTVQKRIDSTHADFKLKLLNEGIFADGRLLYTVSGSAPISYSENKVLIDHGDFSEEFVNSEEGVRQNFIIDNAPEGTDRLQVKLSVSGMKVENAGKNELHFRTKSPGSIAANELTYNDLKCWDAAGRPLDARLAYEDGHIAITVSVENATFPVTIDPVIRTGGPNAADKQMEIHQNDAWFGYAVASAGDVNGDGYSEVLVGAPKYDNGQVDEGAVFVFPGSAGGLSLSAAVLQGNQVNAQAGTSVSSAGDVNNDGYSDVLVGAPYFDSGQTDEGVAFVHLGSATGIRINASAVLEINQISSGFGISVAAAGDVNGDGRSDVLIGAHQYDNGQSNEGAAFLYYGGGVAVSMSAVALEANQAGAMMGYSVGSAGDLNADGYSEIMVGARLYSNGQAYEGAVFIYEGSATGVIKANPRRLESNQVDARYGHSLAPAGDVNGDGFSDIVIGAYLYDRGFTNQGAAFVHYGKGVGTEVTDGDTLATYPQNEAWFGWAVAGAGDLNGDGYGDVIVGARYFDNGQANEGATFVYYGGAVFGIGKKLAAMQESNQTDGWLGCAVASAGDVNGDGFSDVVIGAYSYDDGQYDEGLALIFHGGASLTSAESVETVAGTIDRSRFGAMVRDAGDINGDGFDDIIVNAPGATLTEGATTIYYGSANGINNGAPLPAQAIPFGRSASGAGDVNGDGYADVIVGSPNVGTGIGGTARIFYGSAAGVNLGTPQVLTEPNNGSLFGIAVASAGDVNGDHYADVIVGASKYKVGSEVRGAAFVYYGSASGVGTAPRILAGVRKNSSAGQAVSSAGDLNGDHYDDIIVGAPTTQDNNTFEVGAALIYYGSANGVENLSLNVGESAANAHFGAAVASLGDTDGDGFSDIAIGAPQSGSGKGGAVKVFHGSATGLTRMEPRSGDLTGMSFGTSVSGGDFDGDGYTDLLVGSSTHPQPDASAGRIHIFRGTRRGFSNTEDFAVSGQAERESLGFSVSVAGDINGDGFSDLVAGMPGFRAWPGSTDVGKIFVYYGNEGLDASQGNSLRNNLRLYNADLNTPYSQNFPGQDAQANFGLGLYTKSFLGRNKGKLVWETRSNGQAYSQQSNNPMSNSTESTGSQNAYANLGASGVELKNLVSKLNPDTRVRARVKYDLVLALTGQVYGPWRYFPAFSSGGNVAPPPQQASMREAQEFFEGPKEQVYVYPNPASDKLFIRLDPESTVAGMKLVSSSGKVVFNLRPNQSELDVRNLPAGIYLLVTTQNNGAENSHKVLIRK